LPPKPGFAFLDTNPKGARQVRGPCSELRLRLPKSPPRVASSGIRDGLRNRLACSKSLRSRLPRCDGPWERASAGAPRGLAHLGGRGGVGARCGHRGSRERRELPASPTGRQTRLHRQRDTGAFAATGDDRGQLHEPNTTGVSAWGGLNERLTMFEESACRPAVRRAAERSCEQSGDETRVGGIGLVAG